MFKPHSSESLYLDLSLRKGSERVNNEKTDREVGKGEASIEGTEIS